MTQDYYGTKRVTAWPEDAQISGIDGPATFKEGYAVKYADGYTSWSPKDVFEAAYKPITAMGFEGALAAVKAGQQVRRDRWVKDGYDVSSLSLREGEVMVSFVNGNTVGWTTPQRLTWDDLLAEDWMIVE